MDTIQARDLSSEEVQALVNGPLRGLPSDYLVSRGLKQARDGVLVPITYQNQVVEELIYRPGQQPKWRLAIRRQWEYPNNLDILSEPHPILWVLEGPKDALYAGYHNLPAISLINGCQSFDPAWTALFTNIQLPLILFDNDDAGRKGAIQAKRHLRRAHVLDWRTAPWPDAQERGYDLADFFQNEHTVQELYAWTYDTFPPSLKSFAKDLLPWSTN